MAKKAAAPKKSKKEKVAPVEQPELHERTITGVEASRIANRDTLAIAYLVKRGGMDEEIAKMVVSSMEPADLLALVEECLTAPAPEAKPEAQPEEVGAKLPDPYIDFTTNPALVSDETFASEVTELAQCAADKSRAEKRYKELKPIVAAKLKAAGAPRSLIGDIQLYQFPGKNVQLSKEKLLEAGVSADLIAKGYVETPYDDIRISRAK